MLKNRTCKIIFLSAAFLLMIAGLSFARTDHREYKDLKPAECNDCHSGQGVTSNHGAFWVKEHRLTAMRANSNCYDCHQQSFCLDCHKGGAIDPDLRKSLSSKGQYMPRSHRSDFISIHAIKAADNPQNCYRCHDSSFCTSCHTNVKQGSMNIKSHRPAGTSQLFNWNSDHGAEARRNLQSCESCHPDADVCIQCHSSGKQNPHPRNWNSIKDRYKQESGGRTCQKCHITF